MKGKDVCVSRGYAYIQIRQVVSGIPPFTRILLRYTLASLIFQHIEEPHKIISTRENLKCWVQYVLVSGEYRTPTREV